MILSRPEVKKAFDVDYYDGSMIHSRFAYKVLRDKVTPAGNIISFVAPATVETEYMIDLEDVIQQDFIYSENMVHFCYELPLTNLWGGVAFQRLFNTIMADILGNVIQKPIEVSGDDIFVHDEFVKEGVTLPKGKASVSIVTECRGAILGHTGINISAGYKAPSFAYSTNMTDEQAQQFQQKCIEAFYQTVHSLFVATTKVI